ncbi:MAG TPA: hypothetical protein DEH25_15960 [Chloroflexi bacterium]|nr:hypothetical protein [Chloroflexota bacterium]
MNPETLLDILHRNAIPIPWSEGDNIPWNEPEFSKRMLKEHLTQDHDLASRRSEKIDLHVQFIHQDVLTGQPGHLLDLACGPGLYASRLAKLGHTIHGIDYSPASIAYAQKTTRTENLASTYQHADIRTTEYGDGYDAALLIYGEFNVFKPADIRQIVRKIHAALKPGGKLITEPHTFEAIEGIGKHSTSWFTSEEGLFSPKPHLVLTENFWDETQKTATIRHFVVDATTGNVIRYAQSLQAYTPAAYRKLLTECGFREIQFYPALTGNPDPEQASLLAITAVKA